MTPAFHETTEAYEAEYRAVRAHMIAQGTSLSEWARNHGVSRQLVAKALRDESFG